MYDTIKSTASRSSANRDLGLTNFPSDTSINLLKDVDSRALQERKADNDNTICHAKGDPAWQTTISASFDKALVGDSLGFSLNLNSG